MKPKTKQGKLSIVLAIAMFLFFYVGSSFTDSLYEGVSSGRTIMEDVVKRPALALSMLTGMSSGISAFFVGLFSITKRRERSFLVYISTLIGLLLTIFLICEVLFPH